MLVSCNCDFDFQGRHHHRIIKAVGSSDRGLCKPSCHVAPFEISVSPEAEPNRNARDVIEESLEPKQECQLN